MLRNVEMYIYYLVDYDVTSVIIEIVAEKLC